MDKKYAPVSLLIPTHNRPEQLRRCYLSVRLQVLLPKQILIIDSPKSKSVSSKEYIFSLSSRDKNISVRWLTARTNDLALKRNMGIKLANEPYLAIIDDDEYADKYWLYHLYRSIKKSGYLVVGGPYVPAHKNNYWNKVYSHLICWPPTGITKNVPGGNCLLDRKRIITNNFSFKEGLLSHEDRIFFSQVFLFNKKSLYFNAKAIVYHDFRTSMLSFTKQWFFMGYAYVPLAKELGSPPLPSAYGMHVYFWFGLLTKDVSFYSGVFFRKLKNIFSFN